MAKKEKEFKPPKGKQPVYSAFKCIMRLLYKKPKVINLAGDIPKRCIIVSNHSAKSGPPALDLYFPVKSCKWGAHEMLGSYKERKAYLRDILYIKKCGAKPGFATSFKASIMAVFSKMIYKGMHVMGTYQDVRLFKTINDSVKVLESDMAIMVYPENSNDGYFEVLTEFFPGFVMLADKYYKKNNEDLPVYPTYYSIKKRIMVIGKPMYVHKLYEEGLSRDEVCEKFKDAVNDLFYEYVQNAEPYKGKDKKQK